MLTKMTASISTASSSVHPTSFRPAAAASCSILRLAMPSSVHKVAGFGARTIRYTSALTAAGVSRDWASERENDALKLERRLVGLAD